MVNEYTYIDDENGKFCRPIPVPGIVITKEYRSMVDLDGNVHPLFEAVKFGMLPLYSTYM